MTNQTTARIEITTPYGSGRRKGWYKLVTGVDTTKSDGYAFAGDSISAGQHDLAVGSVVIAKMPSGSAKHNESIGRVYVVNAGGMEDVAEDYDWDTQFLALRDAVAEHVGAMSSTENQADKSIDLSSVSIDDLLAEIARRAGGAK